MTVEELRADLMRTNLIEVTLELILEICLEHQRNRNGHPNFNAMDIARLAKKALAKTETTEAA